MNYSRFGKLKADNVCVAMKESEGQRIFTRCGCGVRASALTPPGEFGDLPVFGKASNRGSRPNFGSDRSAQQGNTIKSGDGIF